MLTSISQQQNGLHINHLRATFWNVALKADVLKTHTVCQVYTLSYKIYRSSHAKEQ